MKKSLLSNTTPKLSLVLYALSWLVPLNGSGDSSAVWANTINQDLGGGWQNIEMHVYNAGDGWRWIAESGKWVWVSDPLEGSDLTAALWVYNVNKDLGRGWQNIKMHVYNAGDGWHWIAESGKWLWVSDQPEGSDLTAAVWQEVNERWVRNHYADGSSTMSDRDTGLMWVYDVGFIRESWVQAMAYCDDLTYAGYDDWFLPNKDQLAAMFSQKGFFINVQSPSSEGQSWYWSSTPIPPPRYPALIWNVNMATGDVGSSWPLATSYYWIWPCRSLDPTQAIALSGELSFGSVAVGQTASLMLTIENTGTDVLEVSSISYPSGYSGNWSGGTIPAGGSSRVSVTFAPTVEQVYSANVKVVSDAISGWNTLPVSGTGVSLMAQVKGGSLTTNTGMLTVDTFYIGRFEVTWGEWEEVRSWAAANGYDIGNVGNGGYTTKHPVHTVNWFDALKWCNAKSEQEALTPVYTVSGAIYRTGPLAENTTIEQNLSANGFRLPLEAEWEFAARGGNQSNGYTYSGSNDLNAVGWYWDNSGDAAWNLLDERGTWPVGQKAANELGLYDMSGNVWEWCWEPYSELYVSRSIFGGSWSFGERSCTVSSRSGRHPSSRSDNIGFRFVRSHGL